MTKKDVMLQSLFAVAAVGAAVVIFIAIVILLEATGLLSLGQC